MRRAALVATLGSLVVAAACGPSAPAAKRPARDVGPEVDPDGPHRAAVQAQLAPYLQGELVSQIVVGLDDNGRHEVYGFAVGATPTPTGHTLFALGSSSRAFTGLLLADAVQRREVELDQAVAELMPTGVTVPTLGATPITLRHLVLHASGLPPLPPSILAHPDPANLFGSYGENELYSDLQRTKLDHPPGDSIQMSSFGVGVLGYVLGRKQGHGYAAALRERVIAPLGLHETFIGPLPPEVAAKRAAGTDSDLQPAPFWSYTDAYAGALGVVSSVDDQLAFIDAQLDAAAGGQGNLRAPMRLAQESQLEGSDANEGLGWQIDGSGHYWQNGGTSGYRSYVGFDIRTRRGVVILAATNTTLVEWLGPVMFSLLDGKPRDVIKLPTAAQLASYAGTYDLDGRALAVVVKGTHLYVEVDDNRHRLAPIYPNGFWDEDLQGVISFHGEAAGGPVVRAVVRVGDSQFVAPRTP